MTTDVIIDQCLKAIGEADVDAPVEFSRAEVLALINQLYQNDIGKRLKLLATYTYDSSDAAHTITAGVGTLPSDFLLPAQCYDGDAPAQLPLTQIRTIDDKVADDANCRQYMIPNISTLWLFGKTPTNTVKLYYYQKPAALTDSSGSSPTELKDLFHIGTKGIFAYAVKAELAKNQNNTYDMMDMLATVEDLLNEIQFAHGAGNKDNSPESIVDIYGGLV